MAEIKCESCGNTDPTQMKVLPPGHEPQEFDIDGDAVNIHGGLGFPTLNNIPMDFRCESCSTDFMVGSVNVKYS